MRRVLLPLVAFFAVLAFGCSDDDDGGTPKQQGPKSDLVIAGMSAPAKVSFDAQGVLHASCRTDEDCASVQGYFHARDRFFQMDLQRRAARGTLAGLITVGLGTGQDRFLRHYLSTRDGTPIEEAIWEILDDETRGMVEAYARGVNAWLADLRAGRNDAKLSMEYTLPGVRGKPDEIPDWDPLDTVAFARLMTWQLSDSHGEDAEFGAVFPRVNEEQALVLFSPISAERSYTMPASGVEYEPKAQALRQGPTFESEAVAALRSRLHSVGALLDRARAEAEAARAVVFGPAEEARGSNNWTVAPSRTKSGNALLANDPHLGLDNPAVWYLVHLDSVTEGEGTLHYAGASFPGIPGIPIGRNEHVAWGATVAYYDVSDVYVEELTEDGSAVRFDSDGDGTAEEVEIVEKKFALADGKEATLRWVPHHGPIIEEDLESGTALTARWTGHEATNELRAFLELGRAGSVEEAKQALRHFEVGAQNFVLADTAGKIGWYPHAKVPKRPWASWSYASTDGVLAPWMPLPGQGQAEWDGYYGEDELPQLFDPPAAFIATANQDLTGATDDGDPTNDGYLFQTATAAGFRQGRIVELMESFGDEHDVQSMLAIQEDTHSLLGERMLGSFLAFVDECEAGTRTCAPASDDAGEVIDALRAWQFTCPTGLQGSDPAGPATTDETELRESAGCAAFHHLVRNLAAEFHLDELAAAGLPRPPNDLLVRPLILVFGPDRELPFPDEWLDGLWDDVETPDETETAEAGVMEALESTAAQLKQRLGPEPTDWLWGRVHTVAFRSAVHDLAVFVNRGSETQLGPYANDGGLFTVDVANPPSTGSNFSHSSGASLRIVSELSSQGIDTLLQLPGGQSLHRDSEHYGDLIDGWLKNESFELPFARQEVEAATPAPILVGP